MQSRPFLITVIAVFTLLTAIGNSITALDFFGVTDFFGVEDNTTAGLITAGVAVLGLLVAAGLFSLRPWAWAFATIVFALRAAGDVLSFIQLPGGMFSTNLHWTFAILAIVNLALLAYMFSGSVRSAFART
jgi:hypothetical protein